MVYLGKNTIHYMHPIGNTMSPERAPIVSPPESRIAVPPVVARRFVPLPYPSLRRLPSKIHH